MVNKVILVGNLGRDPEVRSTPNGQPVATFSLATNRKWNDRQGNRQEETEWHNIVCWGRQAEVAGQYLRKGKQIYVEGRIQTRSWDDRQTGEKKYRTEVVCENFQMLGQRGDSGYAGGGGDFGGGDWEREGSSRSSGGGAGDGSDSGGNGGGDYGPPSDDDIPF